MRKHSKRSKNTKAPANQVSARQMQNEARKNLIIALVLVGGTILVGYIIQQHQLRQLTKVNDSGSILSEDIRPRQVPSVLDGPWDPDWEPLDEEKVARTLQAVEPPQDPPTQAEIQQNQENNERIAEFLAQTSNPTN